MITPTRTVCYAWTAPGVSPDLMGEEVLCSDEAFPGAICYGDKAYLPDEIERIVVREEEIEKKSQYPWCNKNFNPLNSCDCGNCDKVLALYSKVREKAL